MLIANAKKQLAQCLCDWRFRVTVVVQRFRSTSGDWSLRLYSYRHRMPHWVTRWSFFRDTLNNLWLSFVTRLGRLSMSVHWNPLMQHIKWWIGLPRVPEYSSPTRVVYYSNVFLLLEYSLISISGCKFPFPVAVFLQCRLQSIDELLEFMETWGFMISFATCQRVPS